MSATTNPLALLLGRRSATAFAEPGPTPAQWEGILRAAATVPDHASLRPYRFVIVEGEGRALFGDALAAALRQAKPDTPPDALEKARKKAFAAPALLVLIASPREGVKIPAWEQIASASCTGYAAALAAHALGLGAAWKTAAVLEGEALTAALALLPAERLLGWVLVGTHGAGSPPGSRPEVDLASLAKVLSEKGLRAFGG